VNVKVVRYLREGEVNVRERSANTSVRERRQVVNVKVVQWWCMRGVVGLLQMNFAYEGEREVRMQR